MIDVVLSFPMLKAILQSVTHNLQQLILTIMMILVVVYLYTVLAFNFFRKFYVQEGEDGEEPDRKCHNMLTVCVFDILQPPSLDVIYDIKFLKLVLFIFIVPLKELGA